MKIVQVGTGGWGKNHTRILSQLGVLVAVCDANKEKSREYGEKYSVNHYDSIDSLLESEEFDAAFVCTPTSTHSKIASQIIQAKKHVFVEKTNDLLVRRWRRFGRNCKKEQGFTKLWIY